ncbi:MAG: hypothetical protein HZA89_10325 [Verrucomicrobia bacterium]|nr:hypothetical protein [Verrucomicrobiota bacterium]
MKTNISRIVYSFIAGALVLAGLGCSTTDPAKTSTKAAPLKLDSSQQVDLKKYSVAIVLPFDTSKAKDTDASVGVKFAENIALRLRTDFGPIFDEVKTGGNPSGQPNEIVVTGIIKRYDPGSKIGRAALIGLGAAKLEGELILKDSTDGKVLLGKPFDKLWAWGGIMGMSKDMAEMVTEAEASIANTIARAKGWIPPAKK